MAFSILKFLVSLKIINEMAIKNLSPLFSKYLLNFGVNYD